MGTCRCSAEYHALHQGFTGDKEIENGKKKKEEKEKFVKRIEIVKLGSMSEKTRGINIGDVNRVHGAEG